MQEQENKNFGDHFIHPGEPNQDENDNVNQEEMNQEDNTPITPEKLIQACQSALKATTMLLNVLSNINENLDINDLRMLNVANAFITAELHDLMDRVEEANQDNQ